MFGKIEFAGVAISLLALIAVATDLLRGKIYNWLTFTGFLTGLAYQLSTQGLAGGGQAILGALVALVLFGWMFWLGFMGGGDVKLLMAFGIWGGVHYAEEVAFLAIFLGGFFAILALAVQGRLVDFLRKLYGFLLSILVRDLEVAFPKINRKLTMPFGVPLACAAVWTYFGHPLVGLGLNLWP